MVTCCYFPVVLPLGMPSITVSTPLRVHSVRSPVSVQLLQGVVVCLCGSTFSFCTIICCPKLFWIVSEVLTITFSVTSFISLVISCVPNFELFRVLQTVLTIVLCVFFKIICSVFSFYPAVMLWISCIKFPASFSKFLTVLSPPLTVSFSSAFSIRFPPNLLVS